MNSAYSIKMDIRPELYKSVTEILKVNPTSIENAWEFSIEERSDLFSNALDHLLSILDGRLNKLWNIGIKQEDISIWYFYEYNGQCNIEYNPRELKRIGDMGLTLCISCWEENRQIEL